MKVILMLSIFLGMSAFARPIQSVTVVCDSSNSGHKFITFSADEMCTTKEIYKEGKLDFSVEVCSPQADGHVDMIIFVRGKDSKGNPVEAYAAGSETRLVEYVGSLTSDRVTCNVQR